MKHKRPDILAIPPLYGRVSRIEEIITKVNPHAVVFMGDYFGQSLDADVTATAQWLKKSLHDPNRYHLIGDQDLQYVFHLDFLKRPSFSIEKSSAIGKALNELDWALMRFAYTWENYLFTHAGLQLTWMILMEVPIEDLKDWLDETEEDAWKDLGDGVGHWVHTVPDKDGCFGGLTESSFEVLEPIPGWNQIAGHELDIAKKAEHPEGKAVTLNDTKCVEYPDRVMLITDTQIWMHSTEAILKGGKH